jgi:hypothetical protein
MEMELDEPKDFCEYCANPDGSLQSYDERLSRHAAWFVETQGLTLAAATKQAQTVMASLPAWRDHGALPT